MCQRKNKHHTCFLSLDPRILYSYVCPEILLFTQSDSQLLSSVFSIVGRQMGASVTRKGSLITVSLGTLWGMWVVVERGGARAGACQICRLLLRLIWRGAQEMIKAQVKSLIELSFRLISLLPLLARALNPPPRTLSSGMSFTAQPSVSFRKAGQHRFKIKTHWRAICCLWWGLKINGAKADYLKLTLAVTVAKV